MKIRNKQYGTSFQPLETMEAGIALSGPEVKAVKDGHADITGSYVKILSNEAYLVGAKIFSYRFAPATAQDETRSRKLLLHRSEIRNLKHRLDQKGLTVIPVSLYTKGSYIKAEIALVKGKKQFDKREDIKRRDQERDAARELKRAYQS